VRDDEIGPAAQAMMVGREWELDTITAAMTAARRGAQREVQPVGEPRIGKTALAEQAAVMASGQAYRWCTTPSGAVDSGASEGSAWW
jgi:hypothetical protein